MIVHHATSESRIVAEARLRRASEASLLQLHLADLEVQVVSVQAVQELLPFLRFSDAPILFFALFLLPFRENVRILRSGTTGGGQVGLLVQA